MTFLEEEPISAKTAELLAPLLDKGVRLKIIHFPSEKGGVDKIHLATFNGKTSHFYFSDSFSAKEVNFIIENIFRAIGE
jgi:hypothetical protein